MSYRHEVYKMADKTVRAKVISDIPVESKHSDVPEEYKAAVTGTGTDENPAIVIDCGSESCRAGFTGNDRPTSEFRTTVGRPKTQAKAGGVKDTRQNYVGENACDGTLDVSCPIEHGVVTNWDDMEYIWNYIFSEVLKASAKDRNVLLTEPALNPKINREKMVQIMFETFKASGVYVVNQSLLALYASGRIEGIVLDSGYGLTQVVPVLEGYVVPNAVVTSNLAGHNLSLHMAELLSQKGGFSFNPNAMTADADTLKKMSCYVAQNYDQELRQVAEKSYDLPQGEIIKSIKLGSERIKCPEGLFKPCLMGVDGSGVHEKLYHSISKCDRTTHKTLYANIVLSGGSTMFPGFEDRILKEVKALVAPDTDVKIIAPPNRNQTNWLGGSILGSLSTFGQMWITKKEYDENGPTIVHRKCF